MSLQEVILVDERDRVTGTMEKLMAHQQGKLHRAFSIFIFNSEGEMLLQQRADGKYHSAGLWSNACCSHPAPGEETSAAAHRRLEEELGFDTKLNKLFEFIYETKFENGLTEHEFDHVFAGKFDGRIIPNIEEVKDFRWMGMMEIQRSLKLEPEKYSTWFRLAFPRVEDWVKSNIDLPTTPAETKL